MAFYDRKAKQIDLAQNKRNISVISRGEDYPDFYITADLMSSWANNQKIDADDAIAMFPLGHIDYSGRKYIYAERMEDDSKRLLEVSMTSDKGVLDIRLRETAGEKKREIVDFFNREMARAKEEQRKNGGRTSG